jgi:hypothetical protein
MGVFGFDEHGGGWSWLLPKTTGDENDDLRIWGKPIYAMADGEVRHCLYPPHRICTSMRSAERKPRSAHYGRSCSEAYRFSTRSW